VGKCISLKRNDAGDSFICEDMKGKKVAADNLLPHQTTDKRSKWLHWRSWQDTIDSIEESQ
jgi:hypothetical protein